MIYAPGRQKPLGRHCPFDLIDIGLDLVTSLLGLEANGLVKMTASNEEMKPMSAEWGQLSDVNIFVFILNVVMQCNLLIYRFMYSAACESVN